MPQYDRPFAFQCGCGKVYRGRPAYYRLMEHRATSTNSRCGPVNPSTNAGQGKKRSLSTC